MFSVKGLVESGYLKSRPVPSSYVFKKDPNDGNNIASATEKMPIIDYSLLTSGSAEHRSKTVQAIGNACREWGFFIVINHEVSNTLRDKMLRASENFFDLSEEHKREYAAKKLFDPIRWGTSFNVNVDTTLFWRDYLKVHVHPKFNAPQKPAGFSEIMHEYCKRNRELARELLRGISESLGLENNYIEKAMNLESSSPHHQLLVINLYPPCPTPEVVMGLPPHSDHGLLTILMQNEVEMVGLQVQYHGKWVPVHPPPNAFVVNIGDHMEILSNGKYKSVLHRAVVNSKSTRISIATAQGPPLDTVVSPAPNLLDLENRPASYRGIKYKEYLELQQSHQLNHKICLDCIRI